MDSAKQGPAVRAQTGTARGGACAAASAIFRVAAVLALPWLLASCNESSSQNLSSARIVLNGDLVASGGQVEMKVSLGKEGSTVVVVLEGGDRLRAGNGSSDLSMDYTADIFGSHYRAAFPLNIAATYSTTLARADGSSARSEFPPLPVAFSITAPLPGQTVSLAATPLVNVAWDLAIGAQEQALDTTLACRWNVSPLPAGTSGPQVERTRGDYRVLTPGERSARSASVNLAALANVQRAELQLDNPGASVTLHACDAQFRVYARNFASASPLLSRGSQLASRRQVMTAVDVVP